MDLRTGNGRMLGKLALMTLAMFAFGYALVPLYRAICEETGINVLALRDSKLGIAAPAAPVNTQVDASRWVTVEFDANARGPWTFRPATRELRVHPGELATVMYEFQNAQGRRMAAQAIPSYAPQQAAAHFNKLQCFCFNQYTLEPGERRTWPVVFIVDPKLPRDVQTITLSYTFFEVGGQAVVPAAGVVTSGVGT